MLFRSTDHNAAIESRSQLGRCWLGTMTIALLLLTVPRAGSCETPMGEEALKELSVPAVVAKVRPSVVTVLTRGIPPGGSQHGAPSGSGSGVIIDVGGYILTNNHLVQGMTSVVVGLSTGRLTPGRVSPATSCSTLR